jgi:transposase
MHVRDKMSERAIAKRTGLSRNTVRRWLEITEEVQARRYVQTEKFGKLTALVGELEQALKTDPHRSYG